MSRLARNLLVIGLSVWTIAVVRAQTQAPKIWTEQGLAEWATPVAGLNVRPGHYSEAEYYAAPVDNLKTYPVYAPDREPAHYWTWLQQQKPQPLVDAAEIHSSDDWIAVGERAFRDMDSVIMRTDDPDMIARARDPKAYENVTRFPDGSVKSLRWVVTDKGVMLSVAACAHCHVSVDAGDRPMFAGPGGSNRGGGQKLTAQVPLLGPAGTNVRLQKFYEGDPPPIGFWREFTTPWALDERIEAFKDRPQEATAGLTGPGGLGRSFGGGVFARQNGSPFYVTKITDLQNLRYSKYMDATGTHRLRGPEDVARYAALVTGADSLDFGPHRIYTDAQRHVHFRYADETLYAIGMYLLSLEPPKNPAVQPRQLIDRGAAIFEREGCIECHAPPNYTTGQLTLARGFVPADDHPNRGDILRRTVGTDPGLALKTRKGTGLYKIPSLRGVWYRPLLLHDGSLTTLEEMFDPARTEATYKSTGWTPPGVTERAITGHVFGLRLPADEKAALLAFLRSL